ncbi:hypothetical protein ACP4OV_018548 [Aristida adscensionis]
MKNHGGWPHLKRNSARMSPWLGKRFLIYLYHVAVLSFVLLLAFEAQLVACPSDGGQQTVPSPSPAPISDVDPCAEHIVACNPPGSGEAKWVILVTSVVNMVLLLVPVFRVRGCFLLSASVLPISLLSVIGGLVHVGLAIVAICKTPTPKDSRILAMFPILLFCFIAASVLKVYNIQYTGWFGLALTALSHSFRISSTAYSVNFDWWLFGASLIGAINNFFWLRHPQLCLSREYKITSYVVAVMRATEVVLWSSRSIARFLGRLEGHTEPRAVQNIQLGVMA